MLTGDSYGFHFLTLNSKGNVILAGATEGMPSNADSDVVVAAHTPTGQPVWARRFSSDRTDRAGAVSTDANDNVFVAGSSWNQAGFSSGFIAKLSPDGEELWLRRPAESASANGVATDADGNAVMVTREAEVLKYSPHGDLLWTRPPEAYEAAQDIAVDATGRIFVLLSVATNASLLELSADGELSSFQGLGDPGSSLYQLALDPDGALFTVGNDADFASVLSRFTDTGDAVWSTVLASDFYTGDNLTLDEDGHIFVVGMESSFTDPHYDSFLAKYDAQGNLLWGQRLNEWAGSTPRDLAVSADGRVFVTGASQGGGAFLMSVSPP